MCFRGSQSQSFKRSLLTENFPMWIQHSFIFTFTSLVVQAAFAWAIGHALEVPECLRVKDFGACNIKKEIYYRPNNAERQASENSKDFLPISVMELA